MEFAKNALCKYPYFNHMQIEVQPMTP